jgi:hypothetical protein
MEKDVGDTFLVDVVLGFSENFTAVVRIWLSEAVES